MEKQKIKWNVCLQDVVDNKLCEYSNVPKKSGTYLCSYVTSVPYSRGKLLLMPSLCQMVWDAEKKYWHDVGNPSGYSHNVYAWADVEASDFLDFEYIIGGVIKPSDIGYKKTIINGVEVLEFNDGHNYKL